MTLQATRAIATAPEPTVARRSRLALSAARTFVGVATWISPAHATRAFAPGLVDDDPGTMLVGRLFGVRDLVLGQAVRHPDPLIRRAAIQVGIVVDSADAAASLIALRRGAPKLGAASVCVGALTLVALGVAARSEVPAAERPDAQPSV
jgi:hypothetical protein